MSLSPERLKALAIELAAAMPPTYGAELREERIQELTELIAARMPPRRIEVAESKSVPSETLLTHQEVERRTGFSRAGIYKRIATGTFPRPRHVPGEKSVRWLASEVDAWIRDWVARSVPVDPARR
ncbi:MAG: AlpA family phage regulatory protein [Lysobacteraceae bacterium]